MKIKLFILLLFCFQSHFGVSSTFSSLDDKAKMALNAVWTSYMAWNSGYYWEPASYVINSTNNTITAQDFISYGSTKYSRVELTWKEEVPVEALIDRNRVTITWAGDKIVGLRSEYLSDFDYIVKTNDSGAIVELTSVKLFNKNKAYKIIEYQKGKLSVVTNFIDEGGKPWIRSKKTVSFSDNKVSVNVVVYKLGKPNTEKNISSVADYVYQQIDQNTVFVKTPWGEESTSNYDSEGKVIFSKTQRGTTVITKKSIYEGAELFKTESVSIDNGTFKEKEIKVYLTKRETPESLPFHEHTQGTYKFNEAGELIWEARNNQYREKVGGVWSEWKFFRM